MIETRYQKIALGILVAIIFAAIIVLNGASIRRGFKSLSSQYNNGMNRVITVYDYNGNEIRSWEGKFDVTESETGIMFDRADDGKRVIITGGIIVNEEK